MMKLTRNADISNWVIMGALIKTRENDDEG